MLSHRSLKATSSSASLKPEVRIAQAVSEFGAILSDPHKASFRALASRSPPSFADVIKLTEEVNIDGSRHHKAWMPYGTRLVGILERILVLSQAGDAVIGGSQNLIASGVWGVVKLSLLVATGYLSFFDKLSSFLMRLGNSSAVTRDLALLHPQCRELQKLMSEYLITLVSFCTRIVIFAQSSCLSQVANSLFVSFDKEFNECETELQRWSSLIEKRVTILMSQFQQDTAGILAHASRTFDIIASSDSKKRAKLLLKRKGGILGILCPNQHEYDLAWRRQRKKGTPEWIFADDTYQQWKASNTSTTLWISGKLGSGKTVLLASIVGDTYGAPETRSAANPEPLITFFFCSYEDKSSLRSANIFGSIARQILSISDPDSASLSAAGEFLQSHKSWSAEEILELLLKVLPENQPIFLIIDALDECSGQDLGETILSLKGLLEKRTVRLCCSSRTDSPAYRTASSSFNIDHQIPVTNPSINTEMAAFIDRELQQRKHIYNLGPETEGLIKDMLVAGAHGMYLWVALQIATILPLYDCKLLSESDIRGILFNLPTDLPAAFNRALDRIVDRRYGNTIFQLVAAAQRPLSTQELRVALNVTPGDTDWDVTTLPYDARWIVGACGGGLLEIDEESDDVHFIHHSAAQHLITDSINLDSQQHRFTLDQTHLSLGSICVTYLHYGIFDNQISIPYKLNVDVSKLANKVTETTMASNSLTFKLVSAFKGSQRQRPQGLDIGRVIQQHSTTPPWAEVHYLLEYAKDHWISHTGRFSESACSNTYNLFIKHVLAPMPHILVPWERGNMEACLQWAMESGHESIFSHFVLGDRATETMIQNAIRFLVESPTRFNVNCQKLDLVLLKFLEANCLNVEAIKRLLELGANVNQGVATYASWEGLSSLALAILQMHLQNRKDHLLVELLLNAGANPNGACLAHTDRCLPLNVAIHCQWTTVVRLLIENGADVRYSFEPGASLVIAIESENIEVVEALFPTHFNLFGPLDPRLRGKSHIERAAMNGLPSLIEVLIKKAQSHHNGPRPVIRDDLFLLATQDAQFSTAQFILNETRGSLNWGTSLLNSALEILVRHDIYDANVLTVEILELGADPNHSDSGGDNMLTIALRKSNRPILRALIAYGAAPNFRRSEGKLYPLIIEASFRGWDDVVEDLLQSGVSPHVVSTGEDATRSSCTAFHEAIRSSSYEVVKKLLEWNGNPNIPCYSTGITPLAWAVCQQDIKMIQLLLHPPHDGSIRADLNLMGPYSPLATACQEFAQSSTEDMPRAKAILVFLIDQGAVLSGYEDMLQTMDALCRAARYGEFQVFTGIYDRLDDRFNYKRDVALQVRSILSEDSMDTADHRKIMWHIYPPRPGDIYKMISK